MEMSFLINLLMHHLIKTLSVRSIAQNCKLWWLLHYLNFSSSKKLKPRPNLPNDVQLTSNIKNTFFDRPDKFK